MQFKVADLLRCLQEIKTDGYSYCNIDTMAADAPGEDSYLWVQALEEGGQVAVDFEDVAAVSTREVIMNAWTDNDKKMYGATNIARMQRELIAALPSESQTE